MIFCCALFIETSCTTENKIETEDNYKIASPIVVDTTYNNEYVAEINGVQNVELRSRVSGIIESVLVDEGQMVKKGETLFILNRQEFTQQLKKAKAIIRSAMSELKSAEIELKNTEKLFNQKIVSITDLELLKAKIEGINAKIDEAKSDEEQAELSLSYTMIKAPFDGTINRIPFKVGSFIDEGILLTTISNTSDVFAYFNVAEKDYLEYATTNKKTNSDKVLLVLANGKTYKHGGQIEIIENEIDKNTGTIAFRARFPNPEKLLKHGASGKILVKTILKNVMLIPQKSTFEVQENIYVYTLDDNNIVRMQKINPLYRLSDYFIISSDLSPNSKFVFEGIQYLKSGDKISLETALINKTANK